MKKFQTLHRDTVAQQQPDGTYPFAKNGIQNFLLGSVINEPGFLPSSAQIPFLPIGILETDKYPVIFSTNNTYSAIGFFDDENDRYLPIINDQNLPFKLKFSTDRFITGQVQRNYKGELVGAFTDKHLPPFYLNFDNPNVTALTDMLLFPTAIPPTLSTRLLTGGTLLPGAYYAALKYRKNDGTESGYLTVSSPIVVAGTIGQVTDKAIEITIKQVDPNYDQVQIAIISKINGVTKALQLLNPVTLSNDGVVIFTGGELTEDITMEEILTPAPDYDRVGAIGQLNDALYLGDLHTREPLKMQRLASLVRLKFHSRLITVDPVYEKMKTGEERSFMHREAYAFYIRYKLTGGKHSQDFHLVGPALTAADRAISPIATAENLSAKRYVVEDTIVTFDQNNKTGYFGKWENQSERYPDTEDYDATSIGGENLRGQLVRHHRFPSIRWCKEHLYHNDVEYGRTKLDMLGVSVENVIIPAEYSDQIIGWEIFYAKRTVANSTVQGQSLLLFGARASDEAQYNSSTYYSTGGNWDSKIHFKKSGAKSLNVDQSIFRFHAFDILYNKPSITPDFLSLELTHRRINIPYTGGYIEDGAIRSANDGPIVYGLDYIQKGVPPTVPSKQIKALKNTQFVPNHIQIGKWQNIGVEGFFGGNISNPELLIPTTDIDMLRVNPNSRRSYTPKGDSVQNTTDFLANLMAIRTDIYVPFTGQSLVRVGVSNTIQSSQVFYHGDTCISDYSFHTYGWWLHGQGQNADEFFKGTKVVRRFICETAANLYTRFEDPANAYSRYYPKSSLPEQDANNYLSNFTRDKEPNQFGYTKDSNALDDLITSNIFNTFVETVSDHPFRIHRGGKLSRQSKFRSWRTFLPLDYYEMQKNMGRIVHLEGMDDHLLIHCQLALFLTQDKAKLESDIIAVTLGTGDIFQFEPQEGVSAKLGFAGTQHQLGCVRTPHGYVFVDSKAGHIFLYKGELQLLDKSISNFFQEFLRVKESNVFTGNGYTIGYDPEFKRLLLTTKNRKLKGSQPAIPFDSNLLPHLSPGSIVVKNGRLQKFLGINTTVYQCQEDEIPVAEDLSVTIPETTPVDSLIGTISGTNVDNYYLTGDGSPFYLESATGKLYLKGSLHYHIRSQYIFNGRGINSNGNTDLFSIVINITAVNQPPEISDAEITINDNTPSGTVIFHLVASDRENAVLQFTIIEGNSNTFSINGSSGAVQVANGNLLNGIHIPRYEVRINVSDGIHNSVGRLIINVTHVNAPPVVTDYSITISDNTPGNSVVLQLDPADDLEGDLIIYTLVAESVPGVFTFNPETLEIRLVDNAFLNPAWINQYVLNITASDEQHEPVLFSVVINVLYDRSNISFVPHEPECLGAIPSCAPGWTLSSDGTICTRITTMPPDITQQNSCLAISQNSAYAAYFTRIYNPGFSNASIGLVSAPPQDVFAEMSNNFQWSNTSGSSTQGPANRTGVWVDSDCNGVRDALGSGVRTTILYNYNNHGSARRIYVGVFGDNEFQLQANGVLIAATNNTTRVENFRIFHIFPVDIINGQNIFNVVGTGDGSVNDAVGLILYDNTASQIRDAQSDAALSIIFSSVSLRGTNSTIATCQPGFSLDIENGNPICKRIETQAPIINPGTTISWAKVRVMDTKRSVAIVLLPNDNTPKQFQDIVVPYYPGIEDHAHCGGTRTLFLNQPKKGTAQKLDCVEGIGSVVEYVVPGGIYFSTISQIAADAQAANDVTTNKQGYANLNGKCIPT